MKVTVHGDIVTITLEDIKFEDLKKLFPEGVQVPDDDGNTAYLLKTGNFTEAAITRFGAVVNKPNNDGDALIQLINPNSSSPEKFVEQAIEPLTALENYEASVKYIINTRKAQIQKIKDTIVVE